jgi:Rrf2 family protein
LKNGRFAISVHILVVLAQFEGEYVSSATIADSININAALVRKELARLKAFGFIESQEGKGGGSRLARPSSEIRISELFKALRQDGEQVFGFCRQSPNASCPVGDRINDELELLYQSIDQSIVERLDKLTFRDLLQRVLR